MKVLRTPEACFQSVPGFAYAPHYLEVASGEGPRLRMHYVDEGPRGAAPVLLLHGEPTWSFLYRGIIAALARMGARVVAPDLVGFGRSDKPAAQKDHSYARHVGWVEQFIRELGLSDVTLLCHDWGGLIGLRVVARDVARFGRVLAVNTALPVGEPLPEALQLWRRRSQEIAEFHVGKIVQRTCLRPLSAEVVAAYDAPFPDASFQAGPRQMPLLIPDSRDDPEAQANLLAWSALSNFRKPFLTVFGEADPYTLGAQRVLRERIPGAAGQRHQLLANVGHFLQEDAGSELASLVTAFVRGPA